MHPFTARATVNVTWYEGPGGFTPSQPCPLLEVPLPPLLLNSEERNSSHLKFFSQACSLKAGASVQPRVEYVRVCACAGVCMLTTARLVAPRMWADLTPDRARQPSKGTPSWDGQVSESREGPAWPPSPVAVVSTPSVAGVLRFTLFPEHMTPLLAP